MLHLPVGCRWQPGEDVPQVGERIDAAATAVFDDGVEDGAAFTRSGVADEEPIFLPTAVGRIEFSMRLLSISSRPSSKNTSRDAHWPKV